MYAQDCNLNSNGVIHPETICAAAECPTFPLLRKGYTSIEKNQRQAPVWLPSCNENSKATTIFKVTELPYILGENNVLNQSV